MVEGLQPLRGDTQHLRELGNQVAEGQMLPVDGFTLVAPGCNIVARPAEALAAVSVIAWWGVCWVIVGDALAPGTPAVLDAVDLRPPQSWVSTFHYMPGTILVFMGDSPAARQEALRAYN